MLKRILKKYRIIGCILIMIFELLGILIILGDNYMFFFSLAYIIENIYGNYLTKFSLTIFIGLAVKESAFAI